MMVVGREEVANSWVHIGSFSHSVRFTTGLQVTTVHGRRPTVQGWPQHQGRSRDGDFGMAQHPQGLVVGIASSALFDLTYSDRVFREKGEDPYREYQAKLIDESLAPRLTWASPLGRSWESQQQMQRVPIYALHSTSMVYSPMTRPSKSCKARASMHSGRMRAPTWMIRCRQADFPSSSAGSTKAQS